MSESPLPAGAPTASVVGLLPYASFAIARDVQRFAFGIVGLGVRSATTVVVATTRLPVIEQPLAIVEARVQSLAKRGSVQSHADALRVGSVLNRIEVPLVALLERVIEILPINALLQRVDVDALVSRVDVNGIIARVDLERVVNEVLAGIELGDLIHDSTTSIVSDLRDTVRSGAATADSRLERIVDRIARRGRPRDLIVPASAIPVS